jgi:hypothetical protein
MECNNIREKFSDYIDEIISSEEKIRIEEHIKSCQECNEYLADMQRSIQYVKDIGDIEPPEWLAPKIMAQIKAEVSPKKGIFHRLFYPLYIKLPIQAVATILIVFSAFYVYKTIQPELTFVEGTSDEREARIRLQENRGTVDPKKSKLEPLKEEKQKIFIEEFKERQDNAQEKPGVTIPSEQTDPPLEKLGVPSVSVQREPGTSEGSLDKEHYKNETASRSPATEEVVEKKGEHISFTVSVKDIEAATHKITEAVIQREGKIIKDEKAEGRRRIIAQLTSKDMHDFKGILQRAGDVQEKKVEVEIPEGILLVEIELIKN